MEFRGVWAVLRGGLLLAVFSRRFASLKTVIPAKAGIQGFTEVLL
ncbi:hypothetical protein [Lysobacter sp. Root690]|nr:hypothetical protein [Lysobacter sp. Root690]